MDTLHELIPDLTELRHLLVAGQHAEEVYAAGHALLHHLLQRQKQAGVKTELLFLNGGESDADNAQSLRLLQEAAHEALTRIRNFTWAGVESVEAFNTRDPQRMRLPHAADLLPKCLSRRIILLQNPRRLLQHAPQEAAAALELLGKATSRSCFAPRDAGIHLLITCPSPTGNALPRRLLRRIPARAFFLKGKLRFRAHKNAPCLTLPLPPEQP